MTYDEMIAVITAHKEGKTIQMKTKGKDEVWLQCEDTNEDWEFSSFDYRIKPEPHYRPFKNTDEVMEAIKEHGLILKEKGYNRYISISQWDTQYVQVNCDDCEYKIAFNRYTFADGTPFGKLEE